MQITRHWDWETTSGMRKAKSRRLGSRMSPITGTNSSFGKRSSSSSRRLCIGVSALSNRINFSIPNDASWRHSSEPIEPAAPVTMTVFSRKLAMISSSEILISGRPSRSSILISRIDCRMILPSMTSSIGGAIRIFRLLSTQ